MIRRVLTVLLFFPLLLPFILTVVPTMLGAAAIWLATGDSDRAERFLMNPVLGWAGNLPLILMPSAGEDG